ncbi:hypothetical protein K469DRAFT_683688 [Zopfia rhizophila CBS 207.26]|uniref:DUF7732 domain-containing protein n=1 Tax=Zopfia rhizophila CBS 207.26 TaxID=1314779 RepID=A0A6A6EGK2_9PEZI|nr:hypothetical protein K469DRAFT_683688 [Zopfia rhizophila CBS 207.26]
MRISTLVTYCLFTTSAINAASIPETNALDLLEAHAANITRSEILSPENALEKRKGGGGKGGGGGGGGKSGGGKSGGSKSGGGKTSRTSNSGGQTKSGSGARRAYGGGGFYGGGASVPYTAGKKTPKGLIAGALLLPAAALAIFPGLWLWSVYPYYYPQPYRFLNQTAVNATGGLNQTLPVVCLCQEFSVCGCDDNNDERYFKDLVGNGSYSALNKTLVTVSDVNGTRTLVINGTLPNGTTAPGGTDSAAPGPALQYSGYWVMGAIVLYTVSFL